MRFSTFTFADQAWLVARVAFGALLGGLVGWERDRAGKSAAAGLGAPVMAAAITLFAPVTLVGIRFVEEGMRSRASLGGDIEVEPDP